MTYRYCQPGCFQSTRQVVAARNINTTPGIGWRKNVGKHRKNGCSTRVSKKTFQESQGLVVDQVHVQSKASIDFRTLRAPCLKFVVSGVRSSRGHPLHSVISGKRGHLSDADYEVLWPLRLRNSVLKITHLVYLNTTNVLNLCGFSITSSGDTPLRSRKMHHCLINERPCNSIPPILNDLAFPYTSENDEAIDGVH